MWKVVSHYNTAASMQETNEATATASFEALSVVHL